MFCRPVSHPDDVEMLRQVRNSCRDFMTRHTAEISPEQQQNWWRKLDPSVDRVFLFYDEDKTKPVGYGVIHYQDSGEWLTGGLIPEARDRGLGAKLFRSLIDLSLWPCWLDVRVDNVRAHKLYLKLGFEEVSRTDTVITMRLP